MVVTTRSQTNRNDDEERRRFVDENRPGAEPQPGATGARRRDPTDPDARARELLGIPEPNTTNPLPSTSEGGPLSSPPDTSPWRLELEDRLRRVTERERRDAPPAPRVGLAANTEYHAALSETGLPALREAHAAMREGHAAPRELAPNAPIPRSHAPARSERSVATNSTDVRRREAELRAAEEMANLQVQRLRIEEDLIQKRLAAQLARIEEGSRRGSRAGSVAESARRVDAWLQGVEGADAPGLSGRNPSPQARGQPTLYENEPTQRRPRTPTPQRPEPQVTPRRRQSTVPDQRTPRTASSSRERASRASREASAAEVIAEHLQNMERHPPKHVYQLPAFAGEPGEWLTFYNSYTESARRYKFTNFENVSRLRNALKGEARQCVQHMLASTINPDLILRVLKKNFGRSDLLIDRAMEELKRLPSVGPSATDLNSFAIKVTNIVATLVNLDWRSYGANPLLIREITDRLSPHLRSRWCTYARENKNRGENELSLMAEFLLNESDAEMEFSHARAPSKRATAGATSTTSASQVRKPSTSGGGVVRRSPAQNQPRTYAIDIATCLSCGGSHKTPECRRLAVMSIRDRWDWARTNRICFKCLNSRHRRDQCRTRGCGEPNCPHAHHRLLHEGEQRAENPPAPAPAPIRTNAVTNSISRAPEPSNEPAYQTLATNAPRHIYSLDVLLKIVPVIVSGPLGELRTHALLDEGSSISLMDQGLAEAIGVTGPECPLALKGVGNMRNECPSKCVQVMMRGLNAGPAHTVTFRTVNKLGLRNQRVPKEDILKYSHMQGLEQACFDLGTPYMLVGADHWHLMVPKEIRLGRQNEPAAVRTDFGWVIHGVLPRVITTEEFRVNHVSAEDMTTNELLKFHFNVDSLGITTTVKPRPEEERAKNIFEETVKRVEGPRYEVGQLWRDDDPELPPNYLSALKRLTNLEKKMDRDADFANKYTEQINNLIEKGYAEEVRDFRPSKKDFYLPHFAVTNINKPGKIRVVFDAAAQVQGRCLNDFILEGPDLLQSLPGILFRFREGVYACTADIAEMFLRIQIKKEDRASQMFLWRKHKNEEPRRYHMKSMIFGAASSPFLAHSVRNKNAEDNNGKFPLAVKEIENNHYMDDYVTSFHTKQDCVKTASEVTASHACGGFALRGWATNCKELLNRIPEDHRAKQMTAFGNKTEKILGMLWDAETDELGFNTKMLRVPTEVMNLTRAPTKREALSTVMSVFDPLGLLAQYVITAKIQLQRLWALNLGWDEPMPEEEVLAFQRWLMNLESVAELKIPRQYLNTGGETRYTLHVFVDASDQAYAAAAYWRAENRNGIAVSLAAAKAKVAPTKPLSIPRLELQAALIGARLQATLKKEHRLPIEDVTIWSDSKTVLHWVRDDARRYNAYVAHRLGEIAEITNAEQWRWVPTRENPADDGTRADPNRRVKKTDRWYVGPSFLLLPPEEWPQEPTKNEAEPEPTELKKRAQCLTLTHEDKVLPNVENFSNYEKLIRTTARIFQLIERLKSKQATSLQLKHIRAAEHVWIQKSQREDFPEELRALARGEMITKKSRIYKLDPYIDEDGIMKMHGRINAAPIPNQIANKPILDARNKYVKLLILNEHSQAHHANNERVVNDLRQRFWLLHLRPTVRAVAAACQYCAVRRAIPQVPAFGDLPPERLEPYTRAFTYCAVDYFGPLTVTIGRRHEKRWVALFTCMTTRAIHLEMVPSLSTDSAIMALRRFGARHGYPRVMWSDNATCFRGADQELKAAYQEWLPALRDFGLTKRMEWKFIPPGAPNQGGAWERMVRSVKTALATTLKTRAPREEILTTLLAEAEHTVNARPLTHVSVDPNDPEALTPHHFLLGGSTGLPITGPCVEADRRTWRATQALADHFWGRWVREYLPTLAPRQSSAAGERQLQPGDVVIVVDAALPRNVWPRGIVVTTYPGPDGAVRSADIRTRGGVFRRPTRKLAVLPVQPRVNAAASTGGSSVTDSAENTTSTAGSANIEP